MHLKHRLFSLHTVYNSVSNNDSSDITQGNFLTFMHAFCSQNNFKAILRSNSIQGKIERKAVIREGYKAPIVSQSIAV